MWICSLKPRTCKLTLILLTAIVGSFSVVACLFQV